MPSYTACSPLEGVADSERVAFQEIASITAGSSRLEGCPAAGGREKNLAAMDAENGWPRSENSRPRSRSQRS